MSESLRVREPGSAHPIEHPLETVETARQPYIAASTLAQQMV
jgi:hypothetical protein